MHTMKGIYNNPIIDANLRKTTMKPNRWCGWTTLLTEEFVKYGVYYMEVRWVWVGLIRSRVGSHYGIWRKWCNLGCRCPPVEQSGCVTIGGTNGHFSCPWVLKKLSWYSSSTTTTTTNITA